MGQFASRNNSAQNLLDIQNVPSEYQGATLTPNVVYSTERKVVPYKPLNRPKRPNGFGSIYREKNRFVAAIPDINGKIVRKIVPSAKDKPLLEEWLAEQRHAKKHGVATRTLHPKMTVSEFLQNWLERTGGLVKMNTRRYYAQSIEKRISPIIGSLRASELSTKSVNNFIAELKSRGYSNSTIRGALIVLNKAYKLAVNERDMFYNPMQGVEMPKASSKVSRPICRKDLESLYREAMKDPWMHARVELGLFIGRRPAEVAGLKWDDIDVDSQSIVISRQILREKGKGLIIDTTKTEEELIVPLSDTQLEILYRLKSHQDQSGITLLNDENWIFPNQKGGRLSPELDTKRWKDLCARAWTRSYQRYQMRKTAYTNLNKSGIDARSLMDYSGHSDIRTLMKSYVHGNPEAERRALAYQDELRKSLTQEENPKLRAV